MFSVKHIVAAITLGTAMLMAPAAVSALPTHHTGTPAAHPVKHHKKKHKKVHRKHSTKAAALHAKGSKALALKSSGHKTVPVSAKTGSRHHPMAM